MKELFYLLILILCFVSAMSFIFNVTQYLKLVRYYPSWQVVEYSSGAKTNLLVVIICLAIMFSMQ